MTTPKPKTALLLFGLAFSLFGLWFILSTLGLLRGAETEIGNRLPGWIIICNLFIGPALILPVAGPWSVPLSLRFFLGTLMFGSILILEISFKRYSIASGAALAILLFEAFWIMPKLNASYRRT